MVKFLFPLLFILPTSLGAILRPVGLVSEFNGRIVGGIPTFIEEYPHQVSLRYLGYHRCGGSILKMNVILTAAHCTSEIAPIELQIVAGITYIRKDEGVKRQVISKIEHEDFHPLEYLNDVALLWLEEGLEFSRYVQPIKLARIGEKLKSGTMVGVSGWGSLYPGGSSPDQLQVVYVTVIGNKECAKMYGDLNPVTDAMMCAGEPFGGKDACYGDSGGPLITNNKQYGIVSWGVSCALPEYPGVHADIGNLRPWIDLQLASY